MTPVPGEGVILTPEKKLTLENPRVSAKFFIINFQYKILIFTRNHPIPLMIVEFYLGFNFSDIRLKNKVALKITLKNNLF